MVHLRRLGLAVFRRPLRAAGLKVRGDGRLVVNNELDGWGRSGGIRCGDDVEQDPRACSKRPELEYAVT